MAHDGWSLIKANRHCPVFSLFFSCESQFLNDILHVHPHQLQSYFVNWLTVAVYSEGERTDASVALGNHIASHSFTCNIVQLKDLSSAGSDSMISPQGAEPSIYL